VLVADPHPVLDLIAARAAEGSRPGARADGARLALVMEGGGMRGVVSASMTAALEEAGLTDVFDLVVGTSAGALNGAALLAGVARACRDAYFGAFTARKFINPWRLLVGRAVVDVAYTLDHADHALDADRHARTLGSPIELHCLVVDVETLEPVALSGLETMEDLRQALLATSRIPLIGGPPVLFRGRRYFDGGLAEPVPVDTALALGATHVLVLQTRPVGVPRSHPTAGLDRLIERRLRTINPALIGLYRTRMPVYEAMMERLARWSAVPGASQPFVLGVRPPAGTPVVSQQERRPEVLRRAAQAAQAQAAALLAGARQPA
jgi:predicted patatin/cPLA2 family phospholipase